MPFEMAQRVQAFAVASFSAKGAITSTLQLAMYLVGAVGWEYAAQTLQLDPESISVRPLFQVGIAIEMKIQLSLQRL